MDGRTNNITMPNVTVIIPVYNVEKYLRRSIDSVLQQTFMDYECILVNDGSTDSCPRICNEYAEQDSRIKVIHKTNGGLSSSRNAGIDAASGEYLFFLDSDDFIPSTALEMLYSNIGNADICAGNLISFHSFSFDAALAPQRRKVTVFGRESAFKNMLRLKPPYIFACGKLYKKDLFADLRYSNCLYEDIDLIYKLIDRCIEIRHVSGVCYFYNLGNPNSITASQYTHAHFAGIENAGNMLNFISQKYPGCIRAAKYYFCQQNFHIYKRMLLSRNFPAEDMYRVKKNIRKYMFFGLYDIRLWHKLLPKIMLFVLGDKISRCFYKYFSS